MAIPNPFLFFLLLIHLGNSLPSLTLNPTPATSLNPTPGPFPQSSNLVIIGSSSLPGKPSKFSYLISIKSPTNCPPFTFGKNSLNPPASTSLRSSCLQGTSKPTPVPVTNSLADLALAPANQINRPFNATGVTYGTIGNASP